MAQGWFLKTVHKEVETLGVKGFPQRSLQQKTVRLLLYFLVLMLLFTILSRAADGMTIARVDVGTISKGALLFEISGQGTIEAGGKRTVSAYSGILVEEVLAEPGKAVKAGEAIFQLNVAELEKKLFQMEQEIKKLELSVKQEKLSGPKTPALSEAEAQRNLEEAMQALEACKREQEYQAQYAKEDLVLAKKDLEQAQEDYEKALARKKEDLIQEKRDALAAAEDALTDVLFEQRDAMEDAQRKIVDANKELDRLEHKDTALKVQQAINQYNQAADGGNYDEIVEARNYLDEVLYGSGGREDHDNEVKKARLALDRAKDDLKMAEEKWDSSVERAKEAIAKAEEELEKLENGTYDFAAEVQTEQERVEAAKDKILEMERGVQNTAFQKDTALRKAEEAVKSAELQLEEARIQDNATLSDQEKERELVSLRVQGYRLDIESKQREAGELRALLSEGGRALSPIDGVVVELYVEAGKQTPETAAAMVAKIEDGYLIKGRADKEKADYAAQKDEMQVTLKGVERPVKAMVLGIKYLDGGEEAEITARLPEGQYTLGADAAFRISKQSGYYTMLLPLKALHYDGQQAFVLVVQNRTSVLGDQATAVRVDVSVIEKDGNNAAVSGNLGKDDQVIFNANKEIAPGDRVRVNDL